MVPLFIMQRFFLIASRSFWKVSYLVLPFNQNIFLLLPVNSLKSRVFPISVFILKTCIYSPSLNKLRHDGRDRGGSNSCIWHWCVSLAIKPLGYLGCQETTRKTTSQLLHCKYGSKKKLMLKTMHLPLMVIFRLEVLLSVLLSSRLACCLVDKQLPEFCSLSRLSIALKQWMKFLVLFLEFVFLAHWPNFLREARPRSHWRLELTSQLHSFKEGMRELDLNISGKNKCLPLVMAPPLNILSCEHTLCSSSSCAAGARSSDSGYILISV